MIPDGWKMPEESKQKISQSLKLYYQNIEKPPLSAETRKKMSDAAKVRPSNRKGVKLSEETKRKISESKTGILHTEETKLKIRRTLTGIQRTEEFKLKHRGELGSNWRGGITKEPYPYEFNNELKTKIYERDNYSCFLCSKSGGRICAHHIDYNKDNNAETNLITLCESCHGRTNFNREYWTKLFMDSMKKVLNLPEEEIG